MTKSYFLRKSKFARYSPKYMENIFRGIQLETKVMRLHKIQVEKIS